MCPKQSSIKGRRSTMPKTSGAALRLNARAAQVAGTAKPRRVRTGCLTCRERHLKCDEATPDCHNCQKSRRICKRGVKLNFLDITIHKPREVPSVDNWEVDFLDESLAVASEYRDGLAKYHVLHTRRNAKQTLEQTPSFEPRRLRQAVLPISAGDRPSFVNDRQVLSEASLPGEWTPVYTLWDHHLLQNQDGATLASPKRTKGHEQHESSHNIGPWPWWSPSNHYDPAVAQIASTRAFHREQSSTASNAPQATHAPSQNGSPRFEAGAQLPATPPEDTMLGTTHSPREYLQEFEEITYMEVFVNEVGSWMDCFDAAHHFSQHVPFKALKTPMLLNALLACGVLHLSMKDKETHQTASIYYDTATSQLLRNLQNPERNTEECATTAVVLNVYEAMTDKPPHRMSHVAGARALIKECGWNAASSGIGSACFWLNVGMEVLDCLATKHPTTWEPNDWGINMNLSSEPDERDYALGGEEIWVQRMFYIVAKIANFRASSPPHQDMSPHAEQMERSSRLCEWQKMKRMCDKWNDACPRTMHPIGYLESSQSRSESCFPKIWLIKQSALLGRLLYHMGQCVLAQTNPLEPAGTSKEMSMLQLHHAHQICGIVAHSQDRSMRTVAVRSIEIAAPSLVDVEEQDELLRILERMNARGGQWLKDVVCKMKRDWSQDREWRHAQPIRSPVSESNKHIGSEDQGMLVGFTTAAPVRPSMPSRTLSSHSGMSAMRPLKLDPSPLMSGDLMEALRSADFRHPEHPYKNWWQPASRTNSIAQFHDDFTGITERGLEVLSHQAT